METHIYITDIHHSPEYSLVILSFIAIHCFRGWDSGEGDLFFRSYILLNITIPQRSIILTHTRIHQQIYSFKIKIFKQTSYTLPHRIINFYCKSSIILICAKFLLVFTPVYLLISAPCPEWFLEIRILHSFFP